MNDDARAAVNNSFFVDVFKMVSGTTIAQLLAMFSMPLMTRLFAPEAFGVMALFSSITGLIGVISCMRYELAIMLPESDAEAANIMSVAISSSFFVSFCTFTLLWCSRYSILHWLNAPNLAPYIFLIPIFVFIHGILLALTYWNSRRRRFGKLSIVKMTTSITTSGIKLGAGYGGYVTAGSLVVANVAGEAIATSILGGQVWLDDRKNLLRWIRWKTMSSMLKRYKKFPLYGSWSSLLNAASWQLPAILLSASFSTTVVGYFVLGFLIIQMPMHIIGNAIGQVFFQRAVEYQIQGKLAELIENVFHQLTLIALFPMLILAVIGKDLYVVLFGHNWAESGIYAQILSVWGFLWLVSSPMSTLFSVLEKQEFGLKWNLVNFLLRLFSLIIGGSTGKPIIAVFLFAFTGLISYGYMNRIILLSAGVSVYHAVKIVRNVLIWFIPAGGCLILCFLLGVHPLVRLSMAAGFVGIWGVFIYRYLVKEHRGQLCFRS